MSFPQKLRDFVDRETWTYAKTMPKWPHEYLVRERVGNEDLLVQLVEHIRTGGYEGTYTGAAGGGQVGRVASWGLRRPLAVK